ncbi:MAG: PEGA domain-containing protein [Gammaproteobacteria bacterium]|nr:PEGA domain-containing protein [Gammaproteobacteria bacterium]
MNLAVHVHDDSGERVYGDGELPLEVGGSTAAVRLGNNGELLAHIGVHDGAAFLVPAAAASINGKPITGSHWLRDGDTVVFPVGHMVFASRGNRIFIHARSGEAVDLPPAQTRPGGRDVVQPVAFKAASGTVLMHRRSHQVLYAALIATFALLAVSTWYMFTARSVSVVLEPVPETMALTGGLLRPRFGGRYLLRPGEYRVMAQLDGYVPLDERITVGQSSNQQFALELEKLPGLVSITAGDLAGAEIVVDGEVIGASPLSDAEIAAGLRRLVVRARNHLPQEQEIEISGGHMRQSFDVPLQPNWAPVTLSSSPPGATVSVDGIELGQTPLTAEVEAGDRELSVDLQGFKEQLVPLTVIAGEPQTLANLELEAADGLLAVSTTPAGVSVTVNGQFRGRTPLELALQPGRRHRVSFARAGYEPASRQVELRPDQRRELSVQLQPILGSVRIVTSPADAEIYVDGQARGNAQVLSLTVAPHTIEVRKDGYAPYKETVTPRRGLEQRLTVVLKTIAEAAAANLPPAISTAAGELVLVRGGSLRMGSVRREQGRRSNEVRRDVELTREFYIGRTEVSNAAFRQFMPEHSSGFMGGVSLDGDDQPAVRVSWQLAARYCNWLSDRDGLPRAYIDRDGRLVAVRPMTTGYRLPSEAEWAWVARFAGGAQPRRYVWGEQLPPPEGAGNFADNAAGSLIAQKLEGYDDGYTVTAPVGTFSRNTLGISELAGNVSEWTHDYYEQGTVDPFLSLVDPLGPQFGDQHVIRGASWMKGNISELRSAWRDRGAQGRPDLGFRIARYAR